jgi:amicyanin
MRDMYPYLSALGVSLIFAAGVGTLVASSPPDRKQPIEIEIREFRFRADTVRVSVGATVRWTNRDQVAHTSTAENGEWKSPLLGPAESFRREFEEAGTYPYYCTPHPFMRGVVIVESPGSGS